MENLKADSLKNEFEEAEMEQKVFSKKMMTKMIIGFSIYILAIIILFVLQQKFSDSLNGSWAILILIPMMFVGRFVFKRFVKSTNKIATENKNRIDQLKKEIESLGNLQTAK